LLVNLIVLTKPVSILRFYIVLIILLLTYGLLTVQAFAKQKNPCLKCHPEFKKSGKNTHAALKIGCETCHIASEDKVHPQQRESMKLRKNLPGLCYDCHDESKFKGYDIHPPVTEGKCTACHNPHRSNSGKLLASNPPEFCFTCHDKANFSKKYVHMVAIGRRCDCHSPHASNKPHLLSTSINELCIGCHRAKGNGRHVVGSLPNGRIHPIDGVPDPNNRKRMMSCASCHNPHSSDFPKLFTSKKICKRCHKYY